MQSLIAYMGGNEKFEERLDYIVILRMQFLQPNIVADNSPKFKPNTSEQNLETNGAGINTIMNIGYYNLPLLTPSSNR